MQIKAYFVMRYTPKTFELCWRLYFLETQYFVPVPWSKLNITWTAACRGLSTKKRFYAFYLFQFDFISTRAKSCPLLHLLFFSLYLSACFTDAAYTQSRKRNRTETAKLFLRRRVSYSSPRCRRLQHTRRPLEIVSCEQFKNCQTLKLFHFFKEKTICP